ncbi:MAG TPA: alkaline phosphatase family protein [Vicinamibacterales bacterium]|nr:alkaline phosphatase family protein [Vicinamibacterales bacterium]
MTRLTARRVGHAAKWMLVVTLAATLATPVALRARPDRLDRDPQDRDRIGMNDQDQDRDGDRGDGDGTSTPIRHLVVIFQENVSFDHYFATYPHAANTDGPAFTAKPGTPLVNGLFPGGLLDHNPNTVTVNGVSNPAQPFRLSHAQAVTCDQDHDYGDEQKSFNAGLMNRFPDTVGVGPCSQPDYGHGKALVMGYYDGNTVTAFWNYAQHFAMNDNSYSTTFGPSTPGALNLIAGQTHGAKLEPDVAGRVGNAAGNVTAIGADGIGTVIGDPRPSPVLDNCTLPSPAAPANPRAYISMHGANVGDLLNKHGVTWGWFQGGFRPAPVTVSPAPSNTPGGSGPIVCGSAHAALPGAGTSYDYIPHHEPFQYYAQTSNPRHLTPSSPSAIGKTDRANHQYDLEDFWAAVHTGHLPAVSYLKAAAFQDGHAGYSDPLDEQDFLIETINRLMQTPEWEHMAIVVLYDDSDGWYDHQMGPIVNQSKTPDDALFGTGNCGTPADGTFNGRCGYGPRQPFLVISPWARANFVDHTLTDQSSVLRFIEDNWGLGRLGNQSTDAIAGSLLNLFDFDERHPRTPRLVLNQDGTP